MDPDRIVPEFDLGPGVVLERVCQNFKGTTILADAKVAMSASKKFAQRYQQVAQIPAPHAETQTLNHYFLHDLSFVARGCYIGCSKPSCYSCTKYFRFHHMGSRFGRTHNNVWVKWYLPSAWVGSDGEVERHSLRMMRVMADSIRATSSLCFRGIVRSRKLCLILQRG